MLLRTIPVFLIFLSGEATDVIPVYYAERAIWQFEVVCPGDPGHGSRFIENNAGGKETCLFVFVSS